MWKKNFEWHALISPPQILVVEENLIKIFSSLSTVKMIQLLKINKKNSDF